MWIVESLKSESEYALFSVLTKVLKLMLECSQSGIIQWAKQSIGISYSGDMPDFLMGGGGGWGHRIVVICSLSPGEMPCPCYIIII